MSYITVIGLIVRLVEVIVIVESAVFLTNIEYIRAVSVEREVIEFVAVLFILVDACQLIFGVIGVGKNDLKRIVLVYYIARLAVVLVVLLVVILVGEEFSVAFANVEYVRAVSVEREVIELLAVFVVLVDACQLFLGVIGVGKNDLKSLILINTGILISALF